MAAEPILISGLTSEPPINGNSNANSTPSQRQKHSGPKFTTSSSTQYIQSCALSNQHAARHDALTLLFQAEKLPPLNTEQPLPPNESPTSQLACSNLWTRLSTLSDSQVTQMLYDVAITRMTAKCALGGAFIAEAGDFAAVTCWERQYAPPAPEGWESKYGPDMVGDVDLSEVLDGLKSNGVPMTQIIKQKPVFGEFWMGVERAKYKYLYPLIWRAAEEKRKTSANSGDISRNGAVTSSDPDDLLKYYYICLTSRNPLVDPPVPGAVRAVIQPLVKRFIEDEGMPAIWIVAANERARDVYGYFGFRVVCDTVVGIDREGRAIRTWCMIYTRD